MISGLLKKINLPYVLKRGTTGRTLEALYVQVLVLDPYEYATGIETDRDNYFEINNSNSRHWNELSCMVPAVCTYLQRKLSFYIVL